MTVKLYDKDSHLKEFTAVVLSCEKENDKYIAVLDRTAFFPEGGGQESDRGSIDEASVFDVQIKDGIIHHYLENPVEVGETVNCRIDWERRFRNMQNHSGEHIISGLVHSIFGYENIGFHLGSSEMTLDFDGELSRKDILRVERLANEAVYKNAKFTAVYPSPDELSKLKYRSKLDLTKNVRIVTVSGYDVCACCAPHVNSASEIGTIKILDFYRFNGGVRLFVKCGTDAIDDYNTKYKNILSISGQLSVKQHETAAAVEKLSSQNARLKFEISLLKKQLIAEKVRNFNTEREVTALFEDGLDIKELQLYADALNKKLPGIRAVFSRQNGAFAFAICGESGRLDAFFRTFCKSLNVRGGGRNGIVQGTVSSEKENIEELFAGYPTK